MYALFIYRKQTKSCGFTYVEGHVCRPGRGRRVAVGSGEKEHLPLPARMRIPQPPQHSDHSPLPPPAVQLCSPKTFAASAARFGSHCCSLQRQDEAQILLLPCPDKKTDGTIRFVEFF